MDRYLETSIRGTPDLPFAHYHFQARPVNSIITQIHWHPEMELLYVRKGSIGIRTDRTDFILCANCLAFINPNELHAIQSLDSNCEYDAFVFSLDLISGPDFHFFQKELIQPLKDGHLRFPRILQQDDPKYDKIFPHLQALCLADKNDTCYKADVYGSTLNVFVAMMDHPGIQRNQPDSQNETVKTCLAFMQEHLSEHLSLPQIAQHVHLHPNYLCTLFKNYTGQTVVENLTRLRIDYAAKLLRTESISVSQVAEACGFDSISFFTQKFKALIGITPKSYSKQFRG